MWCSTGTFQIQYDLPHTRQFIDQVHGNVLAGFKPNTTEADPNFGKCLQCAALDRARRPANISRSVFCQACFDQYCFDPTRPPSAAQLPGRKLVLVNPSPGAIANLSTFFSREKVPIILGFLGAAALLTGLTWFLCVCACISFCRAEADGRRSIRIRRKRQQDRLRGVGKYAKVGDTANDNLWVPPKRASFEMTEVYDPYEPKSERTSRMPSYVEEPLVL
jgi:hypothetical protein